MKQFQSLFYIFAVLFFTIRSGCATSSQDEIFVDDALIKRVEDNWIIKASHSEYSSMKWNMTISEDGTVLLSFKRFLEEKKWGARQLNEEELNQVLVLYREVLASGKTFYVSIPFFVDGPDYDLRFKKDERWYVPNNKQRNIEEELFIGDLWFPLVKYRPLGTPDPSPNEFLKSRRE